MATLKNTLHRMVAWGEDALGVSRGKVVWRGENPRPPFGSEREQARRRRQILGTAGAGARLGTANGVEDVLGAIMEARENEAPRIITLRGGQRAGKRSMMDRLLGRKVA